MYNIKQFYSFIKRIRVDSTYRMNLRLCKRLSQFCHIRDIWPACWLYRVIKNISVKDLGKGVSLFIKFDTSSQNHTAIIDSGSDFSILPFVYLKQLGIHGNRLDKTVIYNVTSATSTEKNAVLGSISLRLQIQNQDESFQIIDHTFLILREQISLNRILLGDTFCKSQNVSIKYSNDDETQVTLNGKIIKLLSDPPTPNPPLTSPNSPLISKLAIQSFDVSEYSSSITSKLVGALKPGVISNQAPDISAQEFVEIDLHFLHSEKKNLITLIIKNKKIYTYFISEQKIQC